MEKRKHPRIALPNLSVDASDGVGFFKGVISDASRFGIRVTDLSKKMNATVKKLTIIVSGQGRNFKMTVKPRWTSRDGGRSFGAEIVSPPWGWTEFVMNFEPRSVDDVWQTVRI